MILPGGATGTTRILLRIEGLVVLAAAVVFYAYQHMRWGLFAACFFVPDLSLLAYSIHARAGAITYNTLHTYVLPIALLLGAIRYPLLLPIALIWFAHIGLDRALGYGLKYATSFQDTHLGRIGRSS